jgi:type II secretory pathway component GspD/PulD (secretin)
MKAVSSIRGNVCLGAGFVAALLSGAGHFTITAAAQTQPAEIKTESKIESRAPETRSANEQYRTFYLTGRTDLHDALDIETDLRNMLPQAHCYYLASESAISLRATPEDMALAEKIIADLDHKRAVYKVAYILTQSNGGTQRVELIVTNGGKTVVKQGTRLPIVTGEADQDSGKPSRQVQYIDIGMNLEASLEGNGEGLRLHTVVEQSKVAEEHSGMGAQDPVIQQTKLDDVSMVTQGKPVVLGSMDIPGGSGREEISVVSELMK